MTKVNDLSFATLRLANELRLPKFKNGKGEPAHSEADGSDWSLNDWYTAAAGELGEAGNVLKKIRRGDYTIAEKHEHLADELADVVTYLDLLAKQCKIDLGEAVAKKFNEVSKKVGADIFIS